jgi:hypothetical protein
MAQLVLQPDGTTGEDTRVNNYNPTTNLCNETVLYVGRINDTNDRYPGLLRFSEIISQIPAGSTITAVQLELYETGLGPTSSFTINIQKLLKPWVESQATWNIYSTGNNWGSPGGSLNAADCSSTVSATISITTTYNHWHTIASTANLVADVQSWVDGAQNNGWRLYPTATGKYTAFASSDNATAGNRPKLTITYTPPTNQAVGQDMTAAPTLPNGTAQITNAIVIGQDMTTAPTLVTDIEIFNNGTFNGQVLGSTKYAAVYLQANVPGAATSDIHVYRSATDGGTYTEITSNCTITEPVADQFLILDKRPAYGTPIIWPANTAYYKITALGKNGYASVYVNVDKPAIYAAIADNSTPPNLAVNLDGHYLTGGHSALANFITPDSDLVLDELYQYNVIAPWEARQNSHEYVVGDVINVSNNNYRCTTAGTSDSSAPTFNTTIGVTTTDGSAVWTRIKTANTADDIFLAPDASGIIYRDAHWRQIYFQYAVACLLRKRGETEIATRMIQGCDKMAKGGLDHLAQASITRPGSGKGIVSANDRPAWQANHAYEIGDVCRPAVTNNRFYIATTAGTSGNSQPSLPASNGGTVNDNGIIWKEWTVTGPVFNSTYNTSYTATGSYSVDTNQNGESLATLAALCAEPESDFYDAGAYRTAALTHIEGTAKLLLIFQSGNGAIPLGDGWENTDQTYNGSGYYGYSTTYGSYTLVLMGTAYYKMAIINPDWDILPYMRKYLERGQLWMETNFNSDATAYGATQSEYPINSQNDNCNRDYVYKILERNDPRHEVHWTTGFWQESVNKFGQFSATGSPTGTVWGQPGLMVAMGMLFSLDDPTNVHASEEDGTIVVSWDSDETEQDGFKVQRQFNGGEWGDEQIVGAEDREYTDTDITTGGNYKYRVCAYSDMAQSEWVESVETVYIEPTVIGQSLTTEPTFDNGEVIISIAGQDFATAPTIDNGTVTYVINITGQSFATAPTIDNGVVTIDVFADDFETATTLDNGTVIFLVVVGANLLTAPEFDNGDASVNVIGQNMVAGGGSSATYAELIVLTDSSVAQQIQDNLYEKV